MAMMPFPPVISASSKCPTVLSMGCRHIIDIAYAKIKELRAAFKAEVDAWYANERAFREQRNEERKKRQALDPSQTVTFFAISMVVVMV